MGFVSLSILPVARTHLDRPSTHHALHMPSAALLGSADAELHAVPTANVPAAQATTCPAPAADPVTGGGGRIIRLSLLSLYDFPAGDQLRPSKPSLRLSLGARHQRFSVTGQGPFGTFMIDLDQVCL